MQKSAQTTILFLLFSMIAYAQSPVSFHINAGIIIGTPYFEPPEGATGQPGIGPLYGVELSTEIAPKLRLRCGVQYAIKGSEFQSPITGEYDVAEGLLGLKLPFPLEVDYTGEVDGEYENRYLDFPVYLQYQALRKVSVGVGYQYSKLLKGHMSGTVDVKALFMNFNDQEFDESALIKNHDQAILAEVNFHILKNLELKLRGSYGIEPIMIEDSSGLGIPKNYYLGMMIGVGL